MRKISEQPRMRWGLWGILALGFALAVPNATPAKAEDCPFPCFEKKQVKKKKYRRYRVSRRYKARHYRINRRRYLPILKRVKPRGLPLRLAMAVIAVESAWRPTARGRAGEMGLMQLTHYTARRWAPRHIRRLRGRHFRRAIYRPHTNLRIGTRYLAWCYRRARGNIGATIGCYNRGPKYMWAWRKNRITRRYVYRVRRLMRA